MKNSLLAIGAICVSSVVASLPIHGRKSPTANAIRLVAEGKHAFRFDTFGSESFWDGALRLHESIAGEPNGGVGPGVPPSAALAVGLKVDINALDRRTKRALARGQINLDDPAVTVALLRSNAVVGVRGFFHGRGQLAAVGITCALCHSTVDDSFAPGLGRRIDGVPNRDLDVGTIISLAQDLSPFANLLGVSQQTVRDVVTSWGPGRFDAHLLLDGKAFRPDGGNASVLIPAASGLGGVNLATYNGWGGISHWNAFVGTLEMGGRGTLFERRLDDPVKFPVAAANGFGNVRNADDRVTEKLHALQMYQLALQPPTPPRGSFDRWAAARGKQLFDGAARCSTCHVGPIYTEPGFNMHTPAEIGIDGFQAERGPYDMYRTTPLRGLSARSKGGYYHDGRFATLGDVVDHYDRHFGLFLTAREKADLVEFLRSL